MYQLTQSTGLMFIPGGFKKADFCIYRTMQVYNSKVFLIIYKCTLYKHTKVKVSSWILKQKVWLIRSLSYRGKKMCWNNINHISINVKCYSKVKLMIIGLFCSQRTDNIKYIHIQASDLYRKRL